MYFDCDTPSRSVKILEYVEQSNLVNSTNVKYVSRDIYISSRTFQQMEFLGKNG